MHPLVTPWTAPRDLPSADKDIQLSITIYANQAISPYFQEKYLEYTYGFRINLWTTLLCGIVYLKGKHQNRKK